MFIYTFMFFFGWGFIL